jgi:adenine-specific DNA-methyltransferase
MTDAEQKRRGAYYTSTDVADFLARWAVPSNGGSVLDPSYGEGALLRAAAQRFEGMRVDPRERLYGVEKDKRTHRVVSADLAQASIARASHLLRADFFEVESGSLPQMAAVVANPPFIRFHRFKGDQRRLALARAQECGVKLSGQCSAWAPFIVHAAAFLENGGRLALVLPTELLHARYAQPVLEFLTASFGAVRIIRFSTKLFPELMQDAVLTLASSKGAPSTAPYIRDVASAADLSDLATLDECSGTVLDVGELLKGVTTARAYSLPLGTRKLYQELSARPDIGRLGSLATVRIGYVSGAAEFFHLSAAAAKSSGIDVKHLRPVIHSARDVRGHRFGKEDWKALILDGGANWLLSPNGSACHDEAVKRLISKGRRQKLHLRRKCADRRPWWRVRFPIAGDALLPCLSHNWLRLALNDASAAASNSLYVVRFHSRSTSTHELAALAAGTSLFQLSSEIEGHALGGGALKVDPREAMRLILPLPTNLTPSSVRNGLARVDRHVRRGKLEAAMKVADSLMLVEGLGLSPKTVAALRSGYALLANARRTH